MCRNRRKLLLLWFYLLLLYKVSATSKEHVQEQTNYGNISISNDNEMLNDFLVICKIPSVSCLEKYVIKYLNDTFESKDNFRLDYLTFIKNDNNYTENTIDEVENEDDNGRSTSNYDVMYVLQEKATKFFMTHNLQFNLPDSIMEGATVQISPRSLEETGAVLKVEILPKQLQSVGEGRILFKKISKSFAILL